MVEYIIGVDAGGTKTNARLYGRDGRELFSADGGFGNMLVERDTALKNIRNAIAGCLTKIPDGIGVFVLVGAAGISADDNEAILRDFLRKSFSSCEIAVETDGCLALYAKLRGKDGILVISGTGSIAYGKLDGNIRRAGGWGQFLGDEGSGYGIALEALRQITREYDGNSGYSGLSTALLKHLDTDVFGVVGFVHSHKKAEIAALLKVIDKVAESGDTVAVSLLEDAGRRLAELAGTVYRKTGFSGAVPVAVNGSALEKTPLVKSTFSAALDLSKFTLTDETCPSAAGAYYYYSARGDSIR